MTALTVNSCSVTFREKKVGERVTNLQNPTKYSRMTAKKQFLVLIYSQFNTAGNSKWAISNILLMTDP